MRTEKCQGRLTVFFEDPFWVGVFERIENGRLSAAKVTFGTEPKDYEVQEYINSNYYRLRFSPSVKTLVRELKKNPKRLQRDAKKNGVSEVYISTNHVGLYEKYGCKFKDEMKDMDGELSRVYVKKIAESELE